MACSTIFFKFIRLIFCLSLLVYITDAKPLTNRHIQRALKYANRLKKEISSEKFQQNICSNNKLIDSLLERCHYEDLKTQIKKLDTILTFSDYWLKEKSQRTYGRVFSLKGLVSSISATKSMLEIKLGPCENEEPFPTVMANILDRIICGLQNI